MAKAKPFNASVNADFGTLVPVGIKKMDGNPVRVSLEDGSVIEIRVMVGEIRRSIDRYDQKGDPIYAVNSAQVVSSVVPSKLRLHAPAKPTKAKAKARKK